MAKPIGSSFSGDPNRNHAQYSFPSPSSPISPAIFHSPSLSGASSSRRFLSPAHVSFQSSSPSTYTMASSPPVNIGSHNLLSFSPSSPPAAPLISPPRPGSKKSSKLLAKSPTSKGKKSRERRAQKENDYMIYLEGPQVYTCAQCRTHLTSHDDIISKSFHGRHGRAYLFDQCVNIKTGPSEDRFLITGLHSVCDIFCKRCKNMVGWTYTKAYEQSQKYKEGKYIIEKINLHLEENCLYTEVIHPAGERNDRWRKRSMSWGDDEQRSTLVYEYRPSSTGFSEFSGISAGTNGRNSSMDVKSPSLTSNSADSYTSTTSGLPSVPSL